MKIELLEKINLFKTYLKYKILYLVQNRDTNKYCEKIDVVYLWADFNDEKWLKKRDNFYQKYFNKKVSKVGRITKRPSMNELKYSIRSIEKYFKDLNKIYIVTDNQIPSWLNLKNKRIKIIDYSVLFKNKKYLPCYNSQAIESYLYRISGLTKKFLYLNDDFFLKSYFSSSDFFTSHGLPQFRLGRKIAQKYNIDENEDSVTFAVRNSGKILDKCYKNENRLTIMHRPYPLSINIMKECEKKFPEAFKETRKNYFRSSGMHALHGFLIPYSSNYENQSILIPPNIFEKDLFYWTNDLKVNLKIFSRIKKRVQTSFCIQEDRKIKLSNKAIYQFNNLMDELFPEKSSFEL